MDNGRDAQGHNASANLIAQAEMSAGIQGFAKVGVTMSD
jgi:hypothetical protein